MSKKEAKAKKAAAGAGTTAMQRQLVSAIGLAKLWWILQKFGKVLLWIYNLLKKNPAVIKVRIYRLGLSVPEVREVKSLEDLAILLSNLKGQSGLLRIEIEVNGQVYVINL